MKILLILLLGVFTYTWTRALIYAMEKSKQEAINHIRKKDWGLCFSSIYRSYCWSFYYYYFMNFDNKHLDNLYPITDRLIETIDTMFPDNEGCIIILGVQNKGEIQLTLSGNERNDFATAAKIMMSATGTLAKLYGEAKEGSNFKL